MEDIHELPRILRVAYFAMHRVSDAHFSKQGVTADQFVLLACLAQHDAITQQELARHAASDASTVRAMLVILEGRGLVVREPHPVDSRARIVMLTRKGRGTFKRLLKSSGPIRQKMIAGFSPGELHRLLESLRRLITNIEVEKRGGSRKSVASPLAAGTLSGKLPC